MRSFRLLVTTGAAALLAIGSAFGEPPARVRGTVTAIDDGSFTVKQRDGRVFTLKTGPTTTYADVVPSSLAQIKVDDYVGTAIKGPPNDSIAVEIVLIPKSMRAGRKGYYPWDPLPDTSGGLVSNVSQAPPKLTDTNMTNGIVTANESSDAGRTLTVALVSGQTARIVVSSTAPIVRFVPSHRSAISLGSTVVVWTKPDTVAGLVAVGKGVTPPM